MSGINNLGDKNRWVGRVLGHESQKEQLGGDSRGCRYRVAIMGKHPLEGGINDDEITFAIVSTTTGSGGGGFRRTCKYPPGDIVHGFYNDTEQQQPVIEGSYGRTAGIKYGSGRFDSKSGYFGKNQPGNLTGRDESNEQVNDCLPRAKPSDDKSKLRQQPFNTMSILGLKYETVPLNTYPYPPAAPFGEGNTSEVFGIAADIPNLEDIPNLLE